jgi:hypothetical protein
MGGTVKVDLGTEERSQRLICPLTGREVDCGLVEDSETGVTVGVARCSRFEPADDVRCQELCVDMLNQGFTLDTDGDG